MSCTWLAQWTMHLDELELGQSRRAPAQTHGSPPQLDQHCLEPGSIPKVAARRQPDAEEQPFRSDSSAPSYREQAVRLSASNGRSSLA